jgi:uncharacterized cupin superfamily protein
MAGVKRHNIFRPEIVHDEGDPAGYETGYDRFGPKIGAKHLGATVYELPPGQSVCPYHYEYTEEEWLIVLEGVATVRTPEGEEELEPGEAVCFPTGPEGAHKITNKGIDEDVRVLMISNVSSTSVAVYPDSDKIGVYPPDKRDKLRFRRETSVDYWDREP